MGGTYRKFPFKIDRGFSSTFFLPCREGALKGSAARDGSGLTGDRSVGRLGQCKLGSKFPRFSKAIVLKNTIVPKKLSPGTYWRLSREVYADIGAIVCSKCGGFIHWLELEAQGHPRNSTASSKARSTFHCCRRPTDTAHQRGIVRAASFPQAPQRVR